MRQDRIALLAALVFLAGAAPQAGEVRPVDPKPLLTAPEKPLDERIKPDKITKLDLPALPSRVTLPLPPRRQVAQQASQVPISAEHWAKAKATIDSGLKYLISQQSSGGAWMPGAGAKPTDSQDKPTPVSVAITALAMKACCQADPAQAQQPYFKNAAMFVLSRQNTDGSFDASAMSNYVTATAVSALATIKDRDYEDRLRQAVTWLQTTQWDQGEGLAPQQDWFGGSGYGNNGRPDMSNTQTMLDAIYDAGLCSDEPAFQRALAFVSRTQNFKQTNPSTWAGNDGGFVYTPANGGESMASEAAGEGRYGEKLPADQPRSLRSYGSMTYAGFKSMLYAGLAPDDIRVRAAYDWLRKNWTFEENPGMGQQGLFYYYHTMARALHVGQQHVVTDESGRTHNWREEMIDALARRQTSEGAWKNTADRWMEGNEVLCTIYSLLALEEAIKPVSE